MRCFPLQPVQEDYDDWRQPPSNQSSLFLADSVPPPPNSSLNFDEMVGCSPLSGTTILWPANLIMFVGFFPNNFTLSSSSLSWKSLYSLAFMSLSFFCAAAAAVNNAI